MKKSFFLTIATLLIGGVAVFAQQQPNNAGFENWESAGGGMDPVHWSDMTTGDLCWLCGAGSSKRVFQDTDAHSGTYSARIESTDALGTIVNGNMTMGEVNAPSTTPSEGFNKTVRSNNDFHQDFTSLPDSVVFWAKYNKTDASDSARATFVLHGDYDVREPSDAASTDSIVAKAVMNFQTGGTSQWVRISIPFDYNSWPADPSTTLYVLGTFTSSYSPGAGSNSSILWVDDLEFIYDAPVSADFTASATSVCDGTPISFTDNSTGTPTSWSWNFGDGSPVSSVQNPTHTFTSAGTFDVTLTVTSPNGPSTHTESIIVNAIPNVSTAPDFAVCENEPVTLSGSGATTYSWDNGVTNGQAFTPTSTTTYTVTGTTNGCSNTSSVTVTVDTQPSTGTATSLNACNGDNSVNLMESLSDEDPGGTWIDNDGTGAVSGNTLDATGLVVGNTYNFTYQFAANGACSVTSTATTVTISNSVSAGTTTTNNSTCNSGTFDLFSSITGYSAGGSWNNDNNQGTINTSGVLDANGVTPGTYNYTYAISSGPCGTASITVPITINGVPNITFTGDTEICVGSSATVTATGANTYSWDGGLTGATQTFNPVSTSTYDVSGTGSNGCVSTASLLLTVNSLPSGSVSQGSEVCENSGDVSVTLSGSGTAPFTFEYNIDGGANQTVTSTGNDAVILLPSNTPGTSTVNVLSIQDNNTCSEAMNEMVSITVNPLPTATLTGDVTVCLGDPEPAVTFTGANAMAPYIFTYNVNSGSNQMITSTGNIATISVPTTTGGTFTYNLVSVQDNSTTQCEQTQTGTITVNVVDVSNVSIANFNTDTICVTASPIALPAGSPSGGTYSGNGVSGSNFDPALAGVGTHTITYEFGTAGCTGTATTEITVDGCASIEENTLTAFSMVPNPATENVTINLNNDINGTIAIIDLSGKIVYNSAINGLENTISVSNLNKGMYFVKVTDENGNQSGEKLMVK